MTFKDLKSGQWFDFINEFNTTSFWVRCKKISARRYIDEKGYYHKIGSISAPVYHVSDNMESSQ